MATVLWEGTSRLDQQSPIAVFATGHDRPSKNSKTGDVIQTWIMRTDMSPLDAVKTGADFAICGGCMHRGSSCYVNVGQAPMSIYRAEDRYWYTTNAFARGRKVRLGAYGDPAAVPYEFWAELLSGARSWLGYTHQWLSCDQRMKRFCMASVESLAERDQAHGLGWRCFMVGTSLEEMPNDRITLCPASAEAGKRMTCSECMSCSGLGLDNRVGDVFIPVHGVKSKVVNFWRKVA